MYTDQDCRLLHSNVNKYKKFDFPYTCKPCFFIYIYFVFQLGSSSYEDVEYIIDGQIYGLNVKVHDEKVNNKRDVVVNGDDQDGPNNKTDVQSVINEFRPQGI